MTNYEIVIQPVPNLPGMLTTKTQGTTTTAEVDLSHVHELPVAEIRCNGRRMLLVVQRSGKVVMRADAESAPPAKPETKHTTPS